MPTQAKAEKIEELAEKLKHATMTILVQTQGLKVKDMNDLRNKMRAAKLEFLVAKNTLLRIATERNNMTEVDKGIFNGPTAGSFVYEDEVAAANTPTHFIATYQFLLLKPPHLFRLALL